MIEKIGLKGKYVVEHIRDGKIIGVHEILNAIVDVGLNALLDVVFHSGTQVTSWYIGLVDNTGWTAFANADTMASHGGWSELTAYSETVRQTWGVGAASARSNTNSSAAVFSMNATNTVKGLFITSVNTKSGTTGTLFSTAAFASNINVSNGDTLRVTYTLTG